ncbi:uncharacterized protein LOC142982375 [Anticarsia gemmatalis]|uniref:uncharacterized protein LOC142982375 n=1 Tax=Anticarsia gemmatalis TaxID=129554 RepID=UPI003F75BAC7
MSIVAVNQNLELNTTNDDQAGPSQRGHVNVCLLCGCSIARRQSDKILRDNPTELQQSMINIIKTKIEPRQVTPSDKVCHPCWLRTKRETLRINRIDELRIPDEMPQIEENVIHDHEPPQNLHVDETARPNIIENITLPDYRRAANTGNHCVFTDCTNTGTLHSISDELRAIILRSHKYYLPKLARVCGDHLSVNSWDSLYEAENSITTFNAEQIQHVFSFVNAYNPTLDFKNIDEMDERIFEYWVGFSKEKYNSLLEEIPRISEIKGGKLGLVSLLIKIRTGDSDERIATLVQKPRRSLETLMDRVREVLVQDFVPRNLGIGHLSREQLITHNLMIPNGLYGHENNMIVICDGTYIYINKSSNYMFQKDSYSLHKFRNLLKPFLIVATDGYIIDCFGPYKATTSDAEIMTGLFNNDTSPLRLYFRENDAFILDRGFRDSIRLLEDCGYRTYMPDSLLEGEHQLTTTQANRSRCITLCRWVVEVVNGHLKRDYKILRQEYFHRSLPHMMENFQIAAALLNKFGARLRNNDYANEILNIIRERINFENNLANMIEENNMNRRSANFKVSQLTEKMF